MHEFTVWVPKAKSISVKVADSLHAMSGPNERGWWKATVEHAGPGLDYGFQIDDDPKICRSAQPVAAKRCCVGCRACTTRRPLTGMTAAGRPSVSQCDPLRDT